MTEQLHLGCGTDYKAGWHNVDIVASVGPDEVVDLDNYPWPWEDNTYSQIEAHHVFEHLTDIERALRESYRILQPGGTLTLTLPMGVNAIADPDHSHLWTWQTPAFYCGQRHWDTDTGFTVINKGVSMHSHNPVAVLRWIRERYWGLLQSVHGPGEWCFNQPGMSGEYTIIFQK